MSTFFYILLATSCAGVLATIVGYIFDDLLNEHNYDTIIVSLWTIGTIVFSILFLS